MSMVTVLPLLQTLLARVSTTYRPARSVTFLSAFLVLCGIKRSPGSLTSVEAISKEGPDYAVQHRKENTEATETMCVGWL